MRHAAAVAFAALALSSCADDGSSVAGPGGAAAGASGGVGGSAGSAGGSAGSGGGSAGSGGGSAGAAGVSGTCVESTPSLGRVGPTFEVPTLAETAPKRNPDIAHDSVHDVYLLVTGTEVISGTFLDPDGQSLAPPFAIAQTTEYTQTPRVAYGAGKLLVAWHDNRGSIMPELRARLVSWDGSAPDLQAPDFFVGAPSYQEMGPAMAYSETSELFLVVWHSTPDDDLRARRIDTTGALIGAEIQITNDPDWQSGAAAAWNSVRDEFLVTYTHAGSDGAAVRSQRIRASDGSFVGGEIELGTAAGTWTTQAAYLPCEDRYLVGWVADGALGLRVSAIGEADGAPFAFPSGYGYPDGFALTYHPATNTLATVMHGQTNENYGVAFLASGEQSAVLEATESTGDVGHFNPRITANRLRNEWLMVTSRGFQTIVAQRLGP